MRDERDSWGGGWALEVGDWSDERLQEYVDAARRGEPLPDDELADIVRRVQAEKP